jgi:2-polyprenyl-3-methyl-5-hydroxy-6-metoxy-1,4-benzoquinol methylase
VSRARPTSSPVAYGATEAVCCPYCSAEASSPWASENGFTARRCESCGIVYVSPRPALAEIDESAQSGLHRTERGELATVGLLGFRSSKVRLFRRRLRDLYPNGELASRSVRWLDVGCGYGELVAAVRLEAASGSVVEGIDPCRPKVQVAQKRGLAVSSRGLDALIGRYDVVSLVNVFSHLPDPRAFLVRVASLLEPFGELLIVTGNGGDLRAEEYPDPLYLPDHLLFAGERHVLGLLDELGFTPTAVERYRYFFREAWVVHAAKKLVWRLRGRPVGRWRNEGPFRSLFIRAVRGRSPSNAPRLDDAGRTVQSRSE